MKYPDKHLQSDLEAFSSYSEDELIIKMQKTNPECTPHIAAKILLNKKRNRKNRIILIIAASTLLVALLTFFVAVAEFPWKHTLFSSDVNQKKQQEKPNTVLKKPTSKRSVLPQKDVSPPQQQAETNKSKTK
ncbi:MAG TPA: hypothetical protein ENH23_03520 [candidate division Zixibacteria bacterium]|nr:hypothetical protein [candidate division Zixibacteria bacterium]